HHYPRGKSPAAGSHADLAQGAKRTDRRHGRVGRRGFAAPGRRSLRHAPARPIDVKPQESIPMQLYYDDVLSPRRACAVARHLESPVEFIRVELVKREHRTPDYLALTPNGKVPTLVDGDRVLWEADAIMCHLAARCDSDLWPQDGCQVEVMRWLSWNLQHFYPHAGALYFQYII